MSWLRHELMAVWLGAEGMLGFGTSWVLEAFGGGGGGGVLGSDYSARGVVGAQGFQDFGECRCGIEGMCRRTGTQECYLELPENTMQSDEGA